MLTIKETTEKDKYNVTEETIVFEAKCDNDILGYGICRIDGNVILILKIEYEDDLVEDGIKRAALNYALNRNIIEAEYKNEAIDIIDFFNHKCH